MFILSLLLTHCLASPLVSPLVNLLVSDPEAMVEGAGAAMDMADMTAMGEIKININSRLED